MKKIFFIVFTFVLFNTSLIKSSDASSNTQNFSRLVEIKKEMKNIQAKIEKTNQDYGLEINTDNEMEAFAIRWGIKHLMPYGYAYVVELKSQLEKLSKEAEAYSSQAHKTANDIIEKELKENKQ